MFELLKADASSKARLGRLTTAHGMVDTPVFMSVGTQGSVKAIDPRELRAAVERTMRWAKECRQQPRAGGQMVFGIVQGGASPDLREECAKALVALDFDGYAIGGVSVGEPEPEMMHAVELTETFL